ncbi:DivIVA domain-containing protein [Mariniluteicoccus flavus]
MTLTLDEVRKTKFHMARRTGYEVSEVDLFVDRVEASFAQLTEENSMLKQQVETLKQAQQNASQREERREPSNEELAKQRQAQPVVQQQAPQPVAQASGGSSDKVVVTTSAEASPAVVRLVQMATEQAEQLGVEAHADAKRKVEEANQRAHQITTDARTKADRVESEARVNAEKMTSDARTTAEKLTSEAKSKSENLDRETASRRTQLFADLEGERDRLREAVNQLRGFESSYRQNLTSHLKQQVQAIESGRFEPDNKPALLNRGADKNERSDNKTDEPSGRRSFGHDNKDASSSTPRLDALLGDNNTH